MGTAFFLKFQDCFRELCDKVLLQSVACIVILVNFFERRT